MANWKDVAELIAPYAPTAGRFLGGMSGIPGGSVIGEKLGEALAAAFGVDPTPDAVSNAIQTAPANEVAAKLEALESEAKARWDALARMAESDDKARVEQARVIAETQRAEIAAGVSWFHWRHLLGYVLLLWFLIPIPAFAMLTFRYDGAAANQLTIMLQAVVPLYGFMSALLGYIAADTTRLKTVAITGEQPATMIEQIKGVTKATVSKIPARR